MLALARALFAVVVAEKPAGRFMIRNRTRGWCNGSRGATGERERRAEMRFVSFLVYMLPPTP
jgi:hypothetical protein